MLGLGTASAQLNEPGESDGAHTAANSGGLQSGGCGQSPQTQSGNPEESVKSGVLGVLAREDWVELHHDAGIDGNGGIASNPVRLHIRNLSSRHRRELDIKRNENGKFSGVKQVAKLNVRPGARDDYEMYRCHGTGCGRVDSGSFATVYKGQTNGRLRHCRAVSVPYVTGTRQRRNGSSIQPHTVAIKRLNAIAGGERMTIEPTILMSVGHKDYVAPIEWCGRHEGRACMVLPHFEHEDFRNYFRKMDENWLREYMEALLSALKKIHRQNYIHRDVKPSNFLHNQLKRLPHERYLLVDFGLAQTKGKLEALHNRESSSLKKALNRGGFGGGRRSSVCAVRAPSIKRSHSDHTQRSANTPCPSNNPKRKGGHSGSRQESKRRKGNDGNVLRTHGSSTDNVGPRSERTQKSNSSPPKPSKLEKLPTAKVPDSEVERIQNDIMNVQGIFEDHRKDQYLGQKYKIERAGTRGFRAPEVLLRSNEQGPKLDVWSAGVIMLSIMTGKFPWYQSFTDDEALFEISRVYGIKNLNKLAKTLKRKLNFQYHPSKRVGKPDNTLASYLTESCESMGINGQPTGKASFVVRHLRNGDPKNNRPWTPRCYEFLDKLLSLDPNDRYTAEEALRDPWISESIPV